MRIGVRSGLGRLGAFEAGYAPARRRRDYYRNLLLEPEPAKEVRVFGLLSWLQERYRSHALRAVQPVWKARRRIIYRPYLASIPVALVLSGVASVGVARAAAHGDLTLGELALALQAIVVIGVLAEFFWESDYATEFGFTRTGLSSASSGSSPARMPVTARTRIRPVGLAPRSASKASRSRIPAPTARSCAAST